MKIPLLFLCALAFTLPRLSSAAPWPAWRGAGGSGITTETDLPEKWSSTENVAWKAPLPDRGNSTPIVWKDRVFLTQAVGAERLVICLDRADGRELWRKGVRYNEKDPSHPTNPHASASPVTDGERVIAWFGSGGLICLDFEGAEVWKMDLPQQEHIWGYAGSPVIHGDLCFVYHGPSDDSFLLAVDKRTGKEVWREKVEKFAPAQRFDGFAGRAGEICSFSTPLIVETPERTELVMTVPNLVRSFDPKTGKELWRCEGLNPLIYTSPVFGEGMIVAQGGYGGGDLAVRVGGSGDVTGTHRVWHHQRAKQRIGSGVVKDGYFYVLNTPGTAQCIDLKTGETVWEERLIGPTKRSESWSSMVLSGDRIYVLNQASDAFIIRAAPKFEMIAVNTLEDGLTNSSIAVSDGQLFIRTHKHLWCIGRKQ